MRLTLRTMLAYLDNVLDAGDAHELEQKIEESSFASGLVHRIRDSTRRMRLGAPKVDGKGMGLDANSVAEYLDSTLPSERVPDFEKVCLESDVHLAEVASSHQILTLVLGQPADVSPELRERVYRIGEAEAASNQPVGAYSDFDDLAPAHGSVAAVAAPASTNGSQVVQARTSARTQSGVPMKSLAITLLVVFVIVLATLQVIGVNRIKGLFGLQTTPVAQATGEGEVTAPTPSMPTERPVEKETAPVLPVAGTPTEADSTARPTVSEELASEIPASAPSGGAAAPVGKAPPAESETPASEPAESSGTPTPAEETTAPSGGDAVATTETAGEAPAPVGRYLSEDKVVARFDAKDDAWIRLPPNSTLHAADRLVVLPTYRPQLLLSPGLKVTVVGESMIQLGSAKETTETELTLESGRVLLVPMGDPNVTVNLHLGGRVATLRFADEQSVVAVELSHFLAPGEDPETEAASYVVQVYGVSGKVGWEEPDEALKEINAGEVLALINKDPAALYEGGQFPKWLDGSDLAEIDEKSSDELLRYLTLDRPLSLSLKERSEFRRVEIRALACQSLCSLDMFDASLKALNDEGQHSYWARQVNSLRAAMARGPEVAARVQRSLEKLGPGEAELMYRMLRGYSAKQLTSGGAEELVAALEHDQVCVRVLAYENLFRITGKTQGFRPERSPRLEKRVSKWQRILDDGLIVYVSPPSPLPDRKLISP